MRKVLVALLLAGSLVGCTSEWDPGRATAGSTEYTKATRANAAGGIAPSTVASRKSSSFAALPDRGELLAYDKSRAVRVRGAYTQYPVDLSEAHALRAAMPGGQINIPAPNGETIKLSYQRMVEHPDGNWSWIGRTAEGADAVLTFGEKAVFGNIPYGDEEPLRLTIANGRSWLVATDRSKLGDSNRAVTRSNGPDYLVPPSAIAKAGSGRLSASAQAESAAAAAVGTTVDLVVGYSNGLATALGGDSQAVTRITYLVDVTNQAYINSQVNANVRLVRTVPVTYPDATDNGDALEKLTGYKSGVGSIPVDPAFTALRAARDQYGADVVSFVRDFRTPENNGCGIAWLIGGGQTPIDSTDAPFAYSVVSDGSDVDEGDSKTYFCRDETEAHELGHLMGQVHNSEDSTSTGAHAYSYGYREASTTGFYTVMAYRLADSSQSSIRYFANPNILYSGRPTGVANASDNARSMNLTIPIIAGFRATVVPIIDGRARNDFNGDGASDVLWRNTSTGVNTIWKSANSATTLGVATMADQNWKVAGSGDFDGDGKSDILWRNFSTGANIIWMSANSTTPKAVVAVGDLNWKVAGVGDFNGDGQADILWRHATTGQNTIWKSGSNATLQGITAVPNLDWIVAGVGDFNVDGKSDILWRNTQTGANTIWRSGNSATVQLAASVGDQQWKVVGVADFNGDGAADILWRHNTFGSNTIWKSGNSTTLQAVAAVGDQNWVVAATGDYNGDGNADILWRNLTTGSNVIWRSANSTTTQAVTTSNISWIVAA